MDGQLEGYLIALHGSTHHALDLSINRIIRGEVDGLSKKFCPTAPELSSVIRTEMDWVAKQIEIAKDRAAIADHRVDPVRPKLFEERAADARAKMEAEGRRFLFEADSFSAAASSRRNLRPGSVYVGILGAWYGPDGSLHEPEIRRVSDDEMQEILRADMFEPEQPQEEPVAEVDPPAEPAPEPEFQDVEF
jgi:hypothetical protein